VLKFLYIRHHIDPVELLQIPLVNRRQSIRYPGGGGRRIQRIDEIELPAYFQPEIEPSLVDIVALMAHDFTMEGVKVDLLLSHMQRFVVKHQSLDRAKVFKRPIEPLGIQRGDPKIVFQRGRKEVVKRWRRFW